MLRGCPHQDSMFDHKMHSRYASGEITIFPVWECMYMVKYCVGKNMKIVWTCASK